MLDICLSRPAEPLPASDFGERSPFHQVGGVARRRGSERLLERARKNSTGVAIRRPVRRATAGVKCLVLCVMNQSGRLAIAESSTGTSAA